MARDYWFAFGTRPAAYSGLSPTFITFVNGSGATIAPPTIAETYSGSGHYKVNYNATQTISFVMDGATTSLADSIRYIFGVFDPQDQFGTTLLNLSDRSVTLIAIGTSNIALGNSNIALGMTNVAIGSSNVALGMTNVFLSTSMGQTLVAEGATLVAIGNTLLSLSVAGGIAGIGSTASAFGDNVTQPVDLFGYLKRVVEFLEGNQTYTKATGGLTFSARGGNTLIASKTVADTTTTTTKT